MAIKATLNTVPRIEGETPEQYSARCDAERARREQEKLEQAEALTKRAGVFRVLVSGPGEAFQVFATDAGGAADFLKTRLPALLEAEFQNHRVEIPSGRTSRSKAVRVVEVDSSVCGFKRGDSFETVAKLGQALQVANASSYVSQARNAGKKTFTIKGVTCCFEADYDEAVGIKID